MKNVKFLLTSLFLLTVLALNIFLLHSLFIGLSLGLFYFIYFIYHLGKNLFSNENLCSQLLLGFIFLFGLIICCSTILYYTIGLFNWVILLVLLIPPITILLLKRKNKSLKNINNETIKQCNNDWLLTIIYLILFIVLLFILFTHTSSDAIVSPWQTVPSYFFIVYFASIFILLLRLFKTQDSLNLLLITFHALITSSVALVIYENGFGFDPFVHRATEKIISEFGFILPKNPYYIGQYSLVAVLAKLLQVNYALLDKILVPFLASLILPVLAYFTFLKFNLEKKLAQIISLFSVFLVLFTCFFTVPQHLANLFLIIFVFLTLLYILKKIIQLNHLWFLAITILCIHPLAGVPALITCFILSFKKINPAPSSKILNSRGIMTLLVFLSLIIVPLIFISASIILSGFDISLNISWLSQIKSTNLSYYLPFHSFLHSLYLLKNYFIVFIVLLAIFGFILLQKKYGRKFFIFPLVIFILLINALLLKFIKFDSLIYYEQNIFPLRLVHSAYFFAIPFILYTIYLILKKINPQKILISILALSFVLTSVFYLAYPRYDNLEKNKGFAVSSVDLEAVQIIEASSLGQDYVVLANQSTSAASLQEFGFKKYYNRQQTIFYYPIPTSSPLYEIYLDITYKGVKQEFINEAKKITGAETVFLVINDYWTNSKKLISQAKNSAKLSFKIDGGKIWVFKY